MIKKIKEMTITFKQLATIHMGCPLNDSKEE
jgi:hypothetical protein